jgi:predicted cupin superfamily sugar epimerase
MQVLKKNISKFVAMKERIAELVKSFDLKPHPEGGWYAETYRSNQKIENGERNLLTSIYFLITSENVSRFHRIKSDELWFFHEGSALTVHTLDENGHTTHKLGLNIENGEQPFLLVMANTIFGSSIDVENGYALVSCAVAPGFDFRDFELFTEQELLVDFSGCSDIIHRLT